MIGFIVDFLSIEVSIATHLSSFFILLGGILLNLLSGMVGLVVTKFIFKKFQSYIQWNLKIIKQSGFKREIK
jgi:uncharacterized membrane protein